MTRFRVVRGIAALCLMFAVTGAFAGPAAAAAGEMPDLATPAKVVKRFWSVLGDSAEMESLGLPGHHLDRTVQSWLDQEMMPRPLYHWTPDGNYEVEVDGDRAVVRCGDSRWRWQFWLVKRDAGWLIEAFVQLPTTVADQIVTYIDVDLADRRIHGRTSMRLVAKTDGIRLVKLQLNPGLKLDALAVEGVEDAHPTASPGGFVVDFDTELDRGQYRQVTFEYEGTPQDVWPNGRVSSGIKPTAAHLFVPLGVSGPWTRPEEGDYHITVPRGFSAIMDGRLVDKSVSEDDETYHFRGQSYGLLVAPFQPVDRTIDGVRVRWNLSYYLDLKGDEALDLTARALAFFVQQYGPHPGDTLTITEAPPEMAGGILLDGGFIALVPYRTPGVSSWKEWPNLVSHEIAHQWWGYKVIGMWPMEAMANYSADAFVASERGEDEWRALMQYHRTKYLEAARQGDVPILGEGRTPPPWGVTYDKGAAVLRMLRYQVGDEAFTKAARLVIDRYGGQPGAPIPFSAWDFMATSEEVSGQDLDWFARQWLTDTDQLDLSLESWRTERTPDGYLTVATITNRGTAVTPFVDVLVDLGRTKKVQRVALTGGATEVVLNTEARPRRLVLDPQAWLFDVNLSNNLIGRLPLDRGSPLRPAIIILGVSVVSGLVALGLWWIVRRLFARPMKGRRLTEQQAVLGTVAVVFSGLSAAYVMFMPNPLYVIGIIALTTLAAVGASGVAVRWEQKGLTDLAAQAGFTVIRRPSDEAADPLLREMRLYCDPAVYRSDFSGEYPYLIGRHDGHIIMVRKPAAGEAGAGGGAGGSPEPKELRIAAYLKAWIRGIIVNTVATGKGAIQSPAGAGDDGFERAFRVESFDHSEVAPILNPEARRQLLAARELGLSRVRISGQGISLYLREALKRPEDLGRLAQVIAVLAAGVREAEKRP
ncbi:MAG: M1 family aminopeptidase [Bacillota bacterium]